MSCISTDLIYLFVQLLTGRGLRTIDEEAQAARDSGRGRDTLQLNWPCDVVVVHRERCVYISDFGHFRIVSLTLSSALFERCACDSA